MAGLNPDLELARRFLAAHGAAGTVVAGVTGAHFYGFPSPDSDLDLKAIHALPTLELLGLEPPRPTVDWTGFFEGVEVDYTSHEIGFALPLLLKGNGNMLERLASPFQVEATPWLAELQALARGTACRRYFRHYRGFFGRKCSECRQAEALGVKALLYTYRAALTGVHLLRTGECVGDVAVLAPLYGFDRVAALVAHKRQAPEKSALPDPGTWEEEWARLEQALLDAHAESPLPEAPPNVEALSAFLVRLRRERLEG